MEIPSEGYEIRQARLFVENRNEFLRIIQEIAQRKSTHLVCFDANNMAGRGHAEVAIQYARRSFFSGKAISNSFEMEALLFAAGSRQCNIAALFGVHEQENEIFVCSYPINECVWEDLSKYMHFVDEIWEEITPDKEDRIKSLFGITQEELELVGTDRIKDLVRERIALLEVNR
jgi:KEOPS complex subunit Cgi121